MYLKSLDYPDETDNDREQSQQARISEIKHYKSFRFRMDFVHEFGVSIFSHATRKVALKQQATGDGTAKPLYKDGPPHRLTN